MGSLPESGLIYQCDFQQPGSHDLNFELGSDNQPPESPVFRPHGKENIPVN